jgi:5-oxoprolinase (ATP-hydrolysing)
MNNFIWGNETFQNYETIAGGSGAGPGLTVRPACRST